MEQIKRNQNSVEWLCERLALKLGTPMAISFYIDHEEEIAEAKAMRKQEMIDFADNYVDNCVIPNENMAIPTIMDVPQYYNETFGGNNEQQ